MQLQWKLVWRILNGLEIGLPHDPASALLGIYPRDSVSYYKDTSSSMFLHALSIIAKKQG